ncbi:MAG: hypothetical protein QM770_10895 [Tepidisphaeraceae bacterium]
MPVTFTADEDGRQADYREEYAPDKLQLKRTGRRVWIVIASEPSTPDAALTAPGIPAIGDDYNVDTGAICLSRAPKVDPETPRTKFIVECTYTNERPQYGGSGGLELKIDYTSESSDESYFKDAQSTPKYAKTTAGEPFAELPKRQRSTRIITVTRDVPGTMTMADFDGLDDCVNQDSITLDGVNYAPRTLLLGSLGLSAMKLVTSTTGYKTLTFTLKRNKNTWDQKFESRGLYQLVSGALTRIAGPDGGPCETAWPLDANGAKLGSASATPAEIVLQPYAPAAMASLLAA